MHRSPFSILWICGAPGVGKSTAGWLVLTGDRPDGVRTALLDVDQLGLRLPMPEDDPDNHRAKLATLDAVTRVLESHGVHRLIVSGVLLPELAARVAELAPGRLRIVRLDCDVEALIGRYLGRNPQARDLPELRAEVERMAALRADDTIDTTGLPRSEVAARISALEREWSPAAGPRAASVEVGTPMHPLPAVWLHGPRAVGSSTAGFTVMLQRFETEATAFIDLCQYGFVRPSPPPPELAALRRDAVAAAAAAFHREGARAVVLVGDPASVGGVDALRAAVPWLQILVGRLAAHQDSLADRIRLRVAGRSNHLVGDDLIGASAEHAAAVLASAPGFESAAGTAFEIDTTHQTAEETAAAVREAAGF